MKNYVQDDDTIPLVAPEGGVLAGLAYLIGAFFGVALTSAAEGDSFELRRKGVATLPKKAAEAWTQGAPLYWDPAANVLTATAGSLKKVAIAASDVAASATSGNAVILPAAV